MLGRLTTSAPADIQAALADPRVMETSKRIECALDEDAERVSTAQSVGAKHEHFIAAPQGSTLRPFSIEDHVARFKQKMARRFAAAQIDALLTELRGFANAPTPIS